MAYGNYALHQGISGMADRMKANKEEDTKLTKLLGTIAPDQDLTGMNLNDKKAAWADYQLQEGIKVAKQKMKDAALERRYKQAQIAQSQAATAASQAQVGIAQENQRYLNHTRDMAAEQQAGEARYLKPYADVAGSQAPGLMNNQAYSRYMETQQNPNLGAAARYMAQTGQVPGPDTMSRYMQPQNPADQLQFTQAPNGQTIATYGKSMQALPNQQANAPREIQLIEALQQRGYSPEEAEKKAIELLGRGLSPTEQMMLNHLMGGTPGATPPINNDRATGAPPQL